MVHVYAIAALVLPVALAQKTTGECSPLKLVYGRATGEPGSATVWSKGYGAAGYSLLNNLTALVPGTTGYPINYPASAAGQSTETGAKDMVNHLTAAVKACPQQKFALGGHSQGGNVTYHAIPRLPKDVLSKIVAVTMFGSPKCPDQVKDRCNSYCYKGDFACDGPDGGAFGRGGVNGAAKGKSGGKSKGKGKGAFVVLEDAQQDKCATLAQEPPTGKTASKGGMPHLAYNTDGFYVVSAACYIADKFKKSN